MPEVEDVAKTILAMEEAALDRWGKGDPSGFLEISDSEMTYFDPFLNHRLDGIEALRGYYQPGVVRIDRYGLIDPKVQLVGEVAILTFSYVSYSGTERYPWNCTEVYRRRDGRWRIVSTHWSFTQGRVIAGEGR